MTSAGSMGGAGSGADVLHAPGQGEHALCGLAFDAFASGDVDAPVMFAFRSQIVTCEDCRRTITFVRKNYRGFKYVEHDKGAP